MNRISAKREWILLSAVVALFGAEPQIAQAHHSFAMFDTSKKVTLIGTVVDFQWANPHVWVDVLGSVGKEPPQKWGMEATSPAMLSRKGWKPTDLKPGDKVTVVLYPNRDGTLSGALCYVILPDRRVLPSYAPPTGIPSEH